MSTAIRPTRWSPAPCAALLLLILSPHAFAATAKPVLWSASLSAAYVSAYHYGDPALDRGASTRPFGGTGMLALSVSRRLHPRVALEGDLGYLSYEQHSSGTMAAVVPAPPSISLQAQFMPIAIGVRYTPLPGAAYRQGPYLKLSPALYVTRWTERVRNPGSTDSFTDAVPGVIAEGGYSGRIARGVGLTAALRYLYSWDIGEAQLGRFSSGSFAGLRQVTYVAGLSFAP